MERREAKDQWTVVSGDWRARPMAADAWVVRGPHVRPSVRPLDALRYDCFRLYRS
jgi:hypothetical protein